MQGKPGVEARNFALFPEVDARASAGWSIPHGNRLLLPSWVCIVLFSFQSISKSSRSTFSHSTDEEMEDQSSEVTWPRPPFWHAFNYTKHQWGAGLHSCCLHASVSSYKKGVHFTSFLYAMGAHEHREKNRFSGIKVVLCHGGTEPSPCLWGAPLRTSSCQGVLQIVEEKRWVGDASRGWGWALGWAAPLLLTQYHFVLCDKHVLVNGAPGEGAR